MFELIAIVSQDNKLICDIPSKFYIPEDLKRFYEITKNNIVVMGRKTFETIKNPLKNRINIVITKNPSLYKDTINLFFCSLENLEKKIKLLAQFNMKVFIIGGSEIYNKLIDKCYVLHLTVVYKSLDNVMDFPNVNLIKFKNITESELHYSEDEKCNFKYITYKI